MELGEVVLDLLELELGCEVLELGEVVLDLLLELELGVRVRPAETWIRLRAFSPTSAGSTGTVPCVTLLRF